MGERSKTGIWILVVILVVFGSVIGTFYFSLKSYMDKIPTIEAKEGVTIQSGDAITLDMVATIDDRMIQYTLEAQWEDGSTEGISLSSDFHTIYVEEGSGNLKVKIGACGTNHEWEGTETIVIVEGKNSADDVGSTVESDALPTDSSENTAEQTDGNTEETTETEEGN